MILKIEREVCLAKYRKFPLYPYDPNTQEEFMFYPKVYSSAWYDLDAKTKREFPKILKSELTGLIEICGFENLIFLGNKTIPWITKLSADRSDLLSLTKAVKYLEANKLGKKFNGGVQVDLPDLPEFIRHFYCITSCDASFHGHHFSDPGQNLLGCIHPYGEVQFQTLNRKFDSEFANLISKTKFRRNNR